MRDLNHPRYLLEEDSVCYGCGYYYSVEETDPTEDLSDEDVDEHGGYCNYNQICIEGSAYEGENW